MKYTAVGIDIAKETFDVAFFGKAQNHLKTFKNVSEGFTSMLSWLESFELSPFHVCMEATGSYSTKLSHFLVEKDIFVSVVNPSLISHFKKSKFIRNKTDQVDAFAIADYCRLNEPSKWTPKSPWHRKLQGYLGRRNQLIEMIRMESNRLSEGVLFQQESNWLQEHLDYLKLQKKSVEKELKDHWKKDDKKRELVDLLCSIPGIQELTALTVIAEVEDISRFSSARKLACFAGLVPHEHQSGTSVYRKPRTSRQSCSRLRTALYMPTLTAYTHNPIIREKKEKMQKQNKPNKLIRVACMRKLLHIIFGVWKSGKSFDSNFEKDKK